MGIKDQNDHQSRAWWSGSLAEFHALEVNAILEGLAYRALQAHPTNRETQLRAWRWELEILRRAIIGLPTAWRLLLEYPLVRLGRRLDAVLVTENAIFVIEFKALESGFSGQARAQAEDYALDLRDFHAGSRDQVIVPIVVAGTGNPERHNGDFFWPDVSAVFESRADGLAALLHEILPKLRPVALDIEAWERAAYRPVPTIIEAARALYGRHGVAEIRNARADAQNLTRTTQKILEVIRDAKREGRFSILFVTGIPGAGKTLCGLDAVFSAETDGTFLTGTLPMVYVLKAALAEDAAKAAAKSARAARHETKSKIESITSFLRYYIAEDKHLPEHVVVFDEAQRAWDADYGARKFGHADSEAGIMLDIMGRHADYAVLVALVGNGQEINTGEAGLAEWGRALEKRPEWNVIAAPGVLTTAEPRQRLFEILPPNLTVNDALHLDVALRNYRSDAAAGWVDAVLRGDAKLAAARAGPENSFYITRSLPAMRQALRAWARGERRAGLVCSSGAKRLVADGLWPRFDHLDEAVVANWFLKRWPDVRASDALEIPATEFACQGLELDYVGLCWGGDLSWNGHWIVRRFKGTLWQNTGKPDAREYRINTYRVLLTRARAETVIWLPAGEAEDKTRAPEMLDRTAAFLLECGARPLPDFNPTLLEKPPQLI